MWQHPRAMHAALSVVSGEFVGGHDDEPRLAQSRAVDVGPEPTSKRVAKGQGLCAQIVHVRDKRDAQSAGYPPAHQQTETVRVNGQDPLDGPSPMDFARLIQHRTQSSPDDRPHPCRRLTLVVGGPRNGDPRHKGVQLRSGLSPIDDRCIFERTREDPEGVRRRGAEERAQHGGRGPVRRRPVPRHDQCSRAMVRCAQGSSMLPVNRPR